MSSNYPPGITLNDIDRSAGAYRVACPKCDRLVYANDLTESGCVECEEEELENDNQQPK